MPAVRRPVVRPGTPLGTHVPAFVVLQGPDKGRTLSADDDCTVIGRTGPGLVLADHTVSRRHAELRHVDGGWLLVDLASANGTYVNGTRIQQPVRIKYGDQIRFGATLVVYTADEHGEQLTSPHIPQEMVALDVGTRAVDAAIVASVPSNDDSIVLAAPETTYALKAWNVLRDFSELTGSLLPPSRLVARILDIICEQVEVARGVILMRQGADGALVPEVVRFRSAAAAEQSQPKPIIASRTIVNYVLRSRAGVLCSNIVSDKRFGSGQSAVHLGMRSVICAPIVARDQILGVIHLDCPLTQHTYNEFELKLITAIGYQAGLAIENARLVQVQLQQERLAAAGETAAYLSHYIKNILQGMRSGADVLQAGLDRQDLGRTAQGWSIVERNLQKTYDLVMNMLAFSKPREPCLEFSRVDPIVDDIVELVRRQVEDADIVLRTKLDDAAPPIPLDRAGVHQVLLNLVTNAIDAVPAAGGIIQVRSAYDPARQELMLAVTDNGPGVPPEQHERIFDPFRSSKGHGGTGLGLAAARKIVQEMGGRIELVTPSEGGAEFRVYLPEAQPSMQTADDTHGPSI